VLNANHFAAATYYPRMRLTGFVIGSNDLANDTRASTVAGGQPMLLWLMNFVGRRAPKASTLSMASTTSSAMRKALGAENSRRLRSGRETRAGCHSGRRPHGGELHADMARRTVAWESTLQNPHHRWAADLDRLPATQLANVRYNSLCRGR
jgi:hypothetical protein